MNSFMVYRRVVHFSTSFPVKNTSLPGWENSRNESYKQCIAGETGQPMPSRTGHAPVLICSDFSIRTAVVQVVPSVRGTLVHVRR